MFKKVNVTGVPLTLELCREWVTMAPMPGERDIRPSRQEYLLTKVRTGGFGGPSWACGVERSTGQKYRLDGQHTSRMLTELPDDVPFPEGLLVTIDTWEFDSLSADGASLFNLFNHPKSARNNEDVMGIYRAHTDVISDLDRSFLVKVGNGIFEYEKGLDPKQALLLQPRERGLYFHTSKGQSYSTFAVWVNSLRSMKNAPFLARPAVIGEMLKHWMIDPANATSFWELVFKENHPEVDHETRGLAETFRSWSVQRKYRGDLYRQKAATAWRHYLREVKAQQQEALERQKTTLVATGVETKV